MTASTPELQSIQVDSDRWRPGLPLDVAALVDSLAPARAGIQLVNLSASETRCLIVQAGGYDEHSFTGVVTKMVNSP